MDDYTKQFVDVFLADAPSYVAADKRALPERESITEQRIVHECTTPQPGVLAAKQHCDSIAINSARPVTSDVISEALRLLGHRLALIVEDELANVKDKKAVCVDVLKDNLRVSVKEFSSPTDLSQPRIAVIYKAFFGAAEVQSVTSPATDAR